MIRKRFDQLFVAAVVIGVLGAASISLMPPATMQALFPNAVLIGLRNEAGTQLSSADAARTNFSVDAYGASYVRNDHPTRWSAGLDAIGATLTEIKAAPGAGLSLYITGWIAQSTTATAGQHTLRFGTGTNCGTGTGNLLAASATARYASPANTVAPTVVQLIPPIKVTANNAVCLLGVATNTTSMTLMGFTAP